MGAEATKDPETKKENKPYRGAKRITAPHSAGGVNILITWVNKKGGKLNKGVTTIWKTGSDIRQVARL